MTISAGIIAYAYYNFALNLEHISSIDPKKCKSNMADNCPWPEIDKYRWMSYSDVILAIECMNRCQHKC